MCAGTTNFSTCGPISKTRLIRFVRHLLASSRRIVEPRSGNGAKCDDRSRSNRVFHFPERWKKCRGCRSCRFEKRKRKKKKGRKETRCREIEKGEKEIEREKMAESAASPGTVQVAANSPQQQQQQSQQQQQTQQNQQPPDISSSQLASPPITGTGTNRKRSRSSGRDYI